MKLYKKVQKRVPCGRCGGKGYIIEHDPRCGGYDRKCTNHHDDYVEEYVEATIDDVEQWRLDTCDIIED